jgi:hypothetical protein
MTFLGPILFVMSEMLVLFALLVLMRRYWQP